MTVRYHRRVRALNHFGIDAHHESGRVVLSLRGELDLASSNVLARELESLADDGTQSVVLDLGALQFIDSTGLRTLLAGQERLRQTGAEFAVTPGGPQVQRLLSITRADEHLRVLASADETSA
jgi:anti-sigma B factor antagonist